MTYIVSVQHKLPEVQISMSRLDLTCLALLCLSLLDLALVQPHANSCHVRRRTLHAPSCFLRPPRSCSTYALVNEGITRHAFTSHGR
jgi:hypothetical protein